MSALDIAQLARSCLDGEGLARVVRERSVMLRFAANRPTQSTAIDDLTVELAGVRGGQVGRAATNRADREGLAHCAAGPPSAELASGPGPPPSAWCANPLPLPEVVRSRYRAADPALGAALWRTLSPCRPAGLEAQGICAGAVEHAIAD